MKRGSISARRLYATLVGLSLTLLLSCSKATAASHLGNTTYLIRLMNFGGVPAGLLVLFCADSITTDYILGIGLNAAGRPVQVGSPPLPPPWSPNTPPPRPNRGATCDRLGGACLRFTPAKLSNANDGEQMFCASKHKLVSKKKNSQTLHLIKQIKG